MPRHAWLQASSALFTLSTCKALLAPVSQAAPASAPAAQAQAPELVLVMVIDGLPAGQLQRYRGQFGQGCLRRLLEQGASS